MTDQSVYVHNLTRVEGHGDIVVNAKDGKVLEARFDIIEAPRFFEAMLKGRRWQEVHYITSRICGICAVGHVSTSLQATEMALGIKITEQAFLFRKLIFYGEQLQSHILHTYFLTAPDFVGAPSVIPLATKAPDVVKRALRLKKLANRLCEVVAGRHVHPVSMTPGGFLYYPSPKALRALKEEILSCSADIDETVKLFAGVTAPEFHRETEFISLKHPTEYGFYEGDIYSSDTKKGIKQIDYRSLIKEKCIDTSTSKHCSANRDSYMVGALARVNNSYDQLHPRAKRAAEALKLKPVCYNTYMINHAQVVETVHCFEEAIATIDRILERGYDENQEPVKPSKMSGRGVGACEVPRGLLIHEYTYDNGLVTDSNLTIPTGMNLENIDADIRYYVPKIITKPHSEVELLLEMLVRAYDPCISCSCHLLKVKFV